MSEVMTLAELRKAAQTRPLTNEEALQLYGPGNPARMRYARRGNAIVARTFGPNEPIGEEWHDSPTAAGAVESHPGRRPDGSDPTETVVGYADPSVVDAPPAVPTSLPPAELAAALREPQSAIGASPQADFGDRDDPSDAGPGTEAGRPLRRR